MTVVCNYNDCPYHTPNNFCSKLVLMIDELGMCREHWRKGQAIIFDKSKKDIQLMQGEESVLEGND